MDIYIITFEKTLSAWFLIQEWMHFQDALLYAMNVT